ncbi:hypothetical protein COU15_01380 [Candidatus Kaiserbacteria bacterium CG10_big_fil_rev_8_21_14_0_10_45_20]|uniref:Type IV secretion system coupling protein TraD DNA-binding domain-containing protein n=1 Tax=Candidatus Kaiserbacteria bacterium CG10_big_fil_rev_8_21_14_0_10_45_20 TaxID=1974607 RepID=A0A2H0UFU7_9BACT|nr:MAG: hypothetical protein COU15_01380 [Candidatus Kaiserbacteria bacterium CG10_big_fil_rev_8_21_14_0_10_45_20]
MNWEEDITYLGNTALKGAQVKFGVKNNDRLRHMCVLGKATHARSEMLTSIALQDIARNTPVVLIDAEGEASRMLVERLTPEQVKRLIFLDPAEAEYPYSFNIVSDIKKLPEEEQAQRLSDVLCSVYKVSPSAFVLHTASLISKKETATILTFFSLISEARARADFFAGDAPAQETFEASLQKETSLTELVMENGKYIAKDTLMRNIFGQPDSKFSLVEHSEDGGAQIVVVDVSRVRMYPTRITPLVRAWIEEARIAGHITKTPVSVLVQDCLRYLGEEEIERSFSDQDIALTVADASFNENDKEKREKALSRCGSIASFASPSSDRSLIERAFYPYVDPEELQDVEEGEMLIALTIDAVRTKPFFAQALQLPPKQNVSYQDVILASREKFSRSQSEVDQLLRFKPSVDDDEDDDDDESGSFSETFRSIFNPPPQKDAPNNIPAQTQPSPAPNKQPSPDTQNETQKNEPEEIPEDDLKQMLFVQPHRQPRPA